LGAVRREYISSQTVSADVLEEMYLYISMLMFPAVARLPDP
jgi:hypothetical protein